MRLSIELGNNHINGLNCGVCSLTDPVLPSPRERHNQRAISGDKSEAYSTVAVLGIDDLAVAVGADIGPVGKKSRAATGYHPDLPRGPRVFGVSSGRSR